MLDELYRSLTSSCPSVVHIDGTAVVDGSVVNGKAGEPDENSLLTGLERQLNIDGSTVESVVLNADGTITHTW